MSDHPKTLPLTALPHRPLNGIRVLQSVFLQFLLVDWVQAQLVERHRQSFLTLQVYPVERRFFPAPRFCTTRAACAFPQSPKNRFLVMCR
jgi:hypothetical protein